MARSRVCGRANAAKPRANRPCSVRMPGLTSSAVAEKSKLASPGALTLRARRAWGSYRCRSWRYCAACARVRPPTTCTQHSGEGKSIAECASCLLTATCVPRQSLPFSRAGDANRHGNARCRLHLTGRSLHLRLLFPGRLRCIPMLLLNLPIRLRCIGAARADNRGKG